MCLGAVRPLVDAASVEPLHLLRLGGGALECGVDRVHSRPGGQIPEGTTVFSYVRVVAGLSLGRVAGGLVAQRAARRADLSISKRCVSGSVSQVRPLRSQDCV